MKATRFSGTVRQAGSRAYVDVPFDPDKNWGAKHRHYVKGSVNGCGFRGLLISDAEHFVLPLGPAWRRDNGVKAGDRVEVVLEPDGPQSEALASDIVEGLDASPKARKLFDSVAPFYRKNFIRWIEQAKRAETRAARIRETVSLLEAGKIER